jgi:hypothetical protein
MKIIFDHSQGHVINDRAFCEVYCIVENETPDELLEIGWLPTSLFDIPYWYQSQSCRINNSKISLSYKRRKIISQLKYKIFKYEEIKEEVDSFFYDYFDNKKLDMKDFYKFNSEHFKLDVMKVTKDDKVVGYTRFQNLVRNNLGMETAYDLNFPRLSLGVTSILLLSDYTRLQNKNNLYIYESYNNYFPYKMEIPGIEFWEGEKWVSNNIYK